MLIIQEKTIKIVGKEVTIKEITSDRGKLVVHLPTGEAKPSFVGSDLTDYRELVADVASYELRQKYEARVEELIRKRYTIGQELSVQRQREEKTLEFNEYKSYCEKCKKIAKEEVLGVTYNG